jgi:hypothetical protein
VSQYLSMDPNVPRLGNIACGCAYRLISFVVFGSEKYLGFRCYLGKLSFLFFSFSFSFFFYKLGATQLLVLNF